MVVRTGSCSPFSTVHTQREFPDRRLLKIESNNAAWNGIEKLETSGDSIFVESESDAKRWRRVIGATPCMSCFKGAHVSREEDVNGMEESYARKSLPAGKVTRSGK